MDAPKAFPPTPKSITLLLQYLHQEPHPKEVNIAILDVPETNYDNDDDDPDSRHHRCANDNASNSTTTTSTVDNYPMRSYAKVQTNLGIHAPDLPILAREFRAEYYFLRRLYRDGFCSSSTTTSNNNSNNNNNMNMTQRSKKLLSTRFFDVTSCLLLVCPDHSTAWADRRRALLVKGDMIFFNEDVFQRELEFLDLLFTQHSKAPSSWGHRKWISQKLVDLIFDATEQQNHNEPIEQQTQITSQSMQHTNDCESEDESAGKLAGTTLVCNSDVTDSRLYKLYQWANSEIKTCSSVSKRFPKNYYAWTHRRWVCRLLFRMWYNQPDSASTSGSVSAEIKLLFDLLTDELSTTQAWSKIHVSDHSAVHYQGQIMRMLLAVGLHPTHGYYCYHNHDQNGNQLHYGYCNTWAWILVNKSIEAARSSSFLAHEVTWIHRRICGFTVLNLMEGCIFGDGGGIGATNDFNGEWSVPFDSTTLSVFLDEFVATEINDVFAVCSTTTNSPERNHALAYIVWMVKKMSESFKERADVVHMMRNALDLLGCDDSIVGNACRIMMNSGKV